MLRNTLLTILLTGFVAAIYGFGIYLFSAIMPDMKNDIGFSYSDAGMVTGIAQISFMLFAILGGNISKKLGSGMTCILSVVVCGIMLLIIPYCGNIYSLGFCLIILGGMAASGYVPIVDILTRFISLKHRGKIMGLISSGTSYGVFVNGLIIPVFIIEGNWRSIWTILGISTLIWVVISIIVFAKLNVFAKPTEENLEDQENGDNNQFKIFERSVLLIFILTFLNGLTVMPFQNFLVPFLRDELGFNVNTTSQIWSGIGFFGMISGFLIGALSDKIGIKKTLILTYILLTLSAVGVLLHSSIVILWVAAICFSFSFYPIFGLVPAYISKRFNPQKATFIFGVANVTVGVGGMLGNVIGGYIKTFSGSFFMVYSIIIGAAALAIIMTFYLKSETVHNK